MTTKTIENVINSFDPKRVNSFIIDGQSYALLFWFGDYSLMYSWEDAASGNSEVVDFKELNIETLSRAIAELNVKQIIV